MKRLLCLLVCSVMLFCLAACGNDGGGDGSIPSVAPDDNRPSVEDSKVLVVYFSMPDSNDSSSVVIDGETLGNTQYMAYVIQENTGANIFRIVPTVPYPTDHDELVDLAQQEQSDNVRPAFNGSIEDFDSYDIVFVGYPNWWADLPMIMYTFFDTYDFSGKKIITFNTHGGSGFSGTTQMGIPERPSVFKNVVDNATQNGDIEPMIVVCPIYNNESPEDSANYTLAFYTLTVNYHNELVNDLIPAVDSTYSTRADRDHRAFCSFSMGSLTTWYTFVNCLDQFRYFIPSSGAMDYQGDDVDAAVTASGHKPEDFFIFACTGTEDFEYRNFTKQIEGMLSMPSKNFIEGENIVFYVKDGYSHDGRVAMEYAYNGLCSVWGKQNVLSTPYTADIKISDVINDSVFGDYGRHIFPVDEGYFSDETLADLRLTWYSNIDANKTVEITNYMKNHAEAGDVIFYDIYTDAEKVADPDKEDTGLFFFKGNPGEKFAVCNAGGGFAYVGAMHDSFPHALERL